MPTFSADSDLLALEPAIFADLPLAGQRLVQVSDAAISGSTLTSSTGGFSVLSPGHVALIQNTPLPIASIAGNTSLSLTRAPIGLSASSGLNLEVRTFAPQAELIYRELLHAVGVDPEDPAGLDESAIVSLDLMRRLETLGVVSRAYQAAIAPVGDDPAIRRKAADYRDRFIRALGEARVLIDLDGDGRPDVWRTPGVARLIRV